MRRMFDIQGSALDERGNRVLDIELTALRTHTEDVRRVLRAKRVLPAANSPAEFAEPFELRYRVTHGDHKKTGLIDPEQARLRLVFEQGRDPDGVWDLTIEADGRNYRCELWRQKLFVQKRLRRTHEQIDDIARRHAPIFVFSRDEHFFPVSLRTLLRSTEIQECSDTMKLKTIFGKEMIPLCDLGDFMRFNGHSEYLLDFNFLTMRRSIFARMGGDPNNATIYYSYYEDPGSDRFYITYHLIYAFDTKAGIARLAGVGPHVFDRESMIMVFEGGGEPSSMIISGHLENQTIFLLRKRKSWKQGRIRVPYDHPGTLKLGTHPVIAVAEGSHALYPTSGIYQLSLLREIAGYLDVDTLPDEAPQARARPPRHADATPLKADAAGDATLIAEQLLIPSALESQVLPHYRLASLGLDRMTSQLRPDADDYDGHNAYLTFSGFWVDVPGTKNARFPPFTRKVSEIGDWVEGAYDWSWDDVPKRFHDNNRVILRLLTENVEDF